MTPHDPTDHADTWAQTIAATAYLADTTHPGFTVWDALREAIDNWCAALVDLNPDHTPPIAWNDPARLRTSIEQLLRLTAPATNATTDGLDQLLTAALSAWLAHIADDVNDGHRFASRP